MRKRGASLIWAMVMSSALLFIAVTTATFIIKESQMSIRMDDSSRAYAAAESGIEWGKFCVEGLQECSASNITVEKTFPTFNIGDSKYTVTISRKLVNGKTETTIKSLGTSSGVNRKIEHVIGETPTLTRVENPERTSPTLTISGSYLQQFDYWTDGLGTANIGISENISGDNSIYFEHSSGKVRLVSKSAGVLNASNYINLPTSNFSISDRYKLRVRIEYFKDLSAKMTILKQNFEVGQPSNECISEPVVIDLRDFDRTKLKSFYYSEAPITKVANEAFYSIPSGVNRAYFANMYTRGIGADTFYTLNISTNTGGSISGRQPEYVIGSTATITAVPTAGYSFTGWSNCATGTTNPLTLVMSSDKTCVANFAIIKLPIYQFWNVSLTDHLYTTERYPAESNLGWVFEGQAFNGASSVLSGAVPIYRYWNTDKKDHFFTQARNDVGLSNIGYSYEGVAFYGFPGTTPGIVTVFQYWNGTDHYYNTTGGEIGGGYSLEGASWYSN